MYTQIDVYTNYEQLCTSTKVSYSRVRSDILKLKGFRQIRQNFLRQMRHTILKIVWGLLCIEIRHLEHSNN